MHRFIRTSFNRLLFILIAFSTVHRNSAAENQPPTFQPLAEPEFQQRFKDWNQNVDDSVRTHRAQEMFFRRGLSSAQVRRLAQSISDEDRRVEFVVSAFHRTVDPENFYDVYDAFQTFSKVFRMHDRITAMKRVAPRPMVITGPAPLSNEELAEIVTTLRHESFDTARLSMLGATGRKAKGRISSAQVGELLDLFSFDNQRLDAAKIAAPWVHDPENLFVLYSKFNFNQHKEQLTLIIAGRNPPPLERQR